MKKIFENKYFYPLLIIVISLLAIFPLFREGFYSFHDEAHIANLFEMTRAISSGQIPPRWAPDMSFNFGYPFFNFYYPFPYYFASFFFFIFNFGLIWSLKTVFILSVPLSGIFFYFMMNKFFSKNYAFAGSVLYMFTPYRAVDLYVRGALGEILAFVIMPLLFLFFYKAVEENRLRNSILAGITFALMLLSHNLTFMIFFPIVFLFNILLILTKDDKLKKIVSLMVSSLIGFFLSAFYIVPAILEKPLITRGTPFDPIDHFPFIKQLIIPFWGYGSSHWGPLDEMSFQIGVVNILIVLLSVVAYLFFFKKLSKNDKVIFGTSLLIFFFAIFLMNVRSYFLWKLLPLGEYVQFPWRFLIITTFITAFMVGFLEKIFNKKKIFLLIPFFSILITIPYFKPQNQTLVDDNYYLKRFFADRLINGKSEEISKQYYQWSEDYLPLLKVTEKRPSDLPKNKIESDNFIVENTEISPINFIGKYNSTKSGIVYFNSYFYPGWISKIDGKITDISAVKPYGKIAVSVPKGEHVVEFSFKETTSRKIADIVSLVSFVLSIMYLIFEKGIIVDVRVEDNRGKVFTEKDHPFYNLFHKNE